MQMQPRDRAPGVPADGARPTAAAASSGPFGAQLRQSLFFGQNNVGVNQLTFAGLVLGYRCCRYAAQVSGMG